MKTKISPIRSNDIKTLFKKSIVSTFMILLAMAPVFASGQTPVQWSRTLQLEGYWEGPVLLTLNGQPFNILYHTDFKSAIDGNAMTMDENFSDASLGELKGANLIGYNLSDEKIHWFSVDNFGTAHEHIGSWVNPNHFHMEHYSDQAGQPFAEVIDIKLKAHGQRAKLTLTATLNGDTVETIAGILYRQNLRLSNAPQSEEGINDIIIYPNPSQGNISISSDLDMAEILITDTLGKQVYHANPMDTDISIKIDVAGIYVVQIVSGGKTISKEVVVSH